MQVHRPHWAQADGHFGNNGHNTAWLSQRTAEAYRQHPTDFALIHSGRMAHFLEDKDPSIVVEAIQAINDACIEDARPELAKATGKVRPLDNDCSLGGVKGEVAAILTKLLKEAKSKFLTCIIKTVEHFGTDVDEPP